MYVGFIFLYILKYDYYFVEFLILKDILLRLMKLNFILNFDLERRGRGVR